MAFQSTSGPDARGHLTPRPLCDRGVPSAQVESKRLGLLFLVSFFFPFCFLLFSFLPSCFLFFPFFVSFFPFFPRFSFFPFPFFTFFFSPFLFFPFFPFVPFFLFFFLLSSFPSVLFCFCPFFSFCPSVCTSLSAHSTDACSAQRETRVQTEVRSCLTLDRVPTRPVLSPVPLGTFWRLRLVSSLR